MPIAYTLMLDQLIQGCRKGDREAQHKLYDFFHGKMMGICMRYTSCRDEAAVILNNGFFKVFTKIDAYDSQQGPIEAWITRIMVNTAIDHYRKEIRKSRTAELSDAHQVTDASTVLDHLAAEDIMQMVQALTPAYRTVFNLYAIEGYSHKEIAEKLGIAEGTSKSNLAKARQKLQAAVHQKQALKKSNYAR